MWKEIKNNSFIHVWEWFVIIVPTVISISLAWFSSSIEHISTKLYLTIIIILMITLAVFIKFFITTLNIVEKSKIILPKLILVRNKKFVFEPSDLFASQSIVSMYYKDGTEEFIGFGYIETVISGTLYLQVIIKEFVSEEWNEETILKHKDKIVLKPSLPKQIGDKVII